MSFKERLQLIKELALKQTVEDRIDRALELNALNMENVMAYKQMVSTDGWQMLESRLLKDIDNKKKKILELAKNPDKNKTDLVINSSILETLERIISNVTGVLKQEKHLIDEKNRLASSLKK
jgi:hypothetical protein